jgi:methyl-accepting chemotaxis protein
MKHASIQRQLALVIALSAGVTILSAAAFYVTMQQAVAESAAIGTRTSESLSRSYAMLEKIDASQSNLQRMLRLRDPDELEKVVSGLETLRKEMDALIGGAGQEAAAIKARVTTVVGTEQRVVEAVLKGDLASGSELFIARASAEYEAVQAEIGRFAAAAKAAGAQHLADSETALRRSMIWRLAALAVVLTAIGMFQWRIKAGLGRRLLSIASTLWQTSSGLASAAGQVAATSQSVSQGSTEQAASLEETSAALEEMAGMIRQSTDNARQAKTLAADARSSAERGAVDMHAMGAAMDQIREASDNIAKIIKTINDIAFQTNILALNAAVEAARAGDAGMGFAVVASEVRSLAQRSAQAAQDTSAKIEDSIAKSRRGIELRDKVVVGLQEIVVKTREVDDLMGAIAVSSDQQRQGIEQVTTAVAQMEKVTQSGAAGAEEGAAAAEELSGMARDAQAVVSQLQELVGAAGVAAANAAGEADADADADADAKELLDLAA